MRWRILVTVAATTLLVLLAFLLPLAVLVGVVAENRATNQATLTAQTLVPLVGSVHRVDLANAVDAQNAGNDLEVSVFLPTGKPVGTPAPEDESVRLAKTGRSLTVDSPQGRTVLVAVEGLSQGTAVIRVFVPNSVLTEGVTRARWVLVGLGAVLLVLALALGDALARSFVRPVADLAATADELAAGDLSARVEPSGPPETRAVGTALNRLAGRITHLLAAERESVADLSHRLRTPITALRLDSEGLRDDEERRRITADVSELSRQVDEVIREARRPVREGLRAVADATAVVAERLRFWQVLAEDTDRQMSVELPTGPVTVDCAAEDLATAVDALLGNVFAHTPEGTSFAVTLGSGADGGMVLRVADAGPGIPSPDLLERGTSAAGSTGLGLDIARRTAEAGGGTLHLGRAPQGGAEVVMVLPAPS